MDKRFRVAQWSQEDIFDKLWSTSNNEYKKGIFIEIGAWDGVEISNTYYLEKVHDWSGILVEPIEQKAIESSHNRWTPVFNGCIWNRQGEVIFRHIKDYSEMLSGIEEEYHPIHRERVNNEIKQFNQKVEYNKIKCETINSLMSLYNIKHADLLSLDGQSAELEILKAYNVKQNPIKAILLDTNGYNKEELAHWFNSNGYELYWNSNKNDEYLYINKDIEWTWNL